MTNPEARDLAAGDAIGCTSAAESAFLETLAMEDAEVAEALRRHQTTVAGLDILMALTPAPGVWERIAQSLD